MKTLEELYNEVLASEELKKEFLAVKPENVKDFAAKYGCEAGLDEIKTFFEAKKSQAGELSDADLDQVAGGKGADAMEAYLSVFSLGLGCLVRAIESTGSNIGTDIEGDKMLCDA